MTLFWRKKEQKPIILNSQVKPFQSFAHMIPKVNEELYNN